MKIYMQIISKISIKKKNLILVIGIILLVVFIGHTIWGNITVGTTYYKVYKENLPASFDGFVIAQISDLHNGEFGKDNSRIIKILKEEQPDIIVITGDLVDSNRTDIEIAVNLVEEAKKIAPCYFVTGNHEAWIGATYDQLENQLHNYGLVTLHDEVVILSKGNDSIMLIGLDDPDFARVPSDEQASMFERKLRDMKLPVGFKILLSHRPEAFSSYVANDIDLVLSGHAHGGQFRFPLIGGLVAPNQGLFPRYDGGMYTQATSLMIVSRGIGNSIIPVRINNRPELVIVELKSQD